MDEIYKRILQQDKDITFVDVENINEHKLCHSSLWYASQGKVKDSQKVFKKIEDIQLDHRCSLIFEAKALVYFSLRELNAAKEFAVASVELNPESLFAYSVLARIAIFEKKYPDAIQYNKKILDYYPDSANATLNIAEAYSLGKNFKEAGHYVAVAKTSVRKKIYELLLPFSSWKIRLLWLALILIFLSSQYVFFSLYIISSVVLIYLFLQWGYKKSDYFIMGRLTYIQLVHTFFFAFPFCELMNKMFSK